MALTILFLFLFVALASFAGLTTDSRDGADWRPTVDGLRASRR